MALSPPPPLLPLKGDFDEYLDQLYDAFLASFVRRRITFRGLRVVSRRHPATKGKHYSFWHVISTEHPDMKGEDNRIPDLRRCERINWIAWTIENCQADGMRCWDQLQRTTKSSVIWCEEHDYAVVLSLRNDYYVLTTAFCELKPGRIKAFQREFESWQRLQAEPDAE